MDTFEEATAAAQRKVELERQQRRLWRSLRLDRGIGSSFDYLDDDYAEIAHDALMAAGPGNRSLQRGWVVRDPIRQAVVLTHAELPKQTLWGWAFIVDPLHWVPGWRAERALNRKAIPVTVLTVTGGSLLGRRIIAQVFRHGKYIYVRTHPALLHLTNPDQFRADCAESIVRGA